MLSRLTSVPLMVWLLWCGSLALSIALVVLLRSRWGQSRPLHKCAVLSLLVHMLLAWVAMSLRIVAGEGGGGGSGPLVHVRIIREGPEGSPAELADEATSDFAPPLLDPPPDVPPPKDETRAKTEEPAELPPQPAPAPPELLPAETTSEVAQAAEAPVPAEDATPQTPVTPQTVDTATAPPPTVIEPPVEVTAQEITQPATSAPTPPARPQAASPYSLRSASDRLGVVKSQGGDGHTEEAVAAALRWLAAAQSRDGRWDANQFGAGQEQVVDGQNRGGAGRNADTGITALALLAFLGAGHTHIEGEYRDTVHHGLDFLLRSQADDGSLFGNATVFAQMYCHSMATFALAEAQAMTGDARLMPAVTKAVNFSLAAQDSSSGGWRYKIGDTPGDTSQLGWQIMALASAERAGVPITSHTWVRVARFLRSVRRGNAGGLASYRPDSGPSTSMTAEALYCRLLLADINVEAIDPATSREATNQLLAAPPDAKRINLYYWYYATLALHHRRERDENAASAWRAWNESLTKTLMETQVASGDDAGSWNTNTVWGGYGGRVYTTAMAAMCLEVYYRYTPVVQTPDRWTATRPQDAGAPR